MLRKIFIVSALSLSMVDPVFSATYTPIEAPHSEPMQPANTAPSQPETAPTQQQNAQTDQAPHAAAAPNSQALEETAQQANPWRLPPDVLQVIRNKGEATLIQDPNNSYVLQEMGIFLLFGTPDDAKRGEQLLQRAIQLNQSNGPLVEKLTSFIQIAGDKGIQTADQMRRFFEAVAKYNPSDSNSYAQLGAVYQMGGEGLQKNYQAAKENYEKALSLDPHNKIALLGLGTLLKNGGDGVNKDEPRSKQLLDEYQSLTGNAQPETEAPTTEQQANPAGLR